MERSWLKDALDRALTESDNRETAVAQFAAAICAAMPLPKVNCNVTGNPDTNEMTATIEIDPTPTLEWLHDFIRECPYDLPVAKTDKEAA